VISVVIPSLGGNLDKTINCLNNGTIVPDEIIVCLPNKNHVVDNASNFNNVEIIYSEKYGQVFQRICGFYKSRYEYVMQLDDDIYVEKDCLENLVKYISRDERRLAVSPYWYNSANNSALHQKKKQGLLMAFYYQIINGEAGYLPGKISLAGTNFGVDFGEVEGNLIEVDWQPGGCVLHNRNNLILQDFYPYRGKAYSEDLMHSLLLRRSGVTLVVIRDAICMTGINLRLFKAKDILADIKSRSHFVKMANLSSIRMSIYYIIYIIKSLVHSPVNEK